MKQHIDLGEAEAALARDPLVRPSAEAVQRREDHIDHMQQPIVRRRRRRASGGKGRRISEPLTATRVKAPRVHSRRSPDSKA